MSELPLDQQPLLPCPQDTPLQVTEQEVAPPVAEGPVKVTKSKSRKQPSKPKPPPLTNYRFVGEEERRARVKRNKEVSARLGLKANNSYIV
jgi:hypothetical protein